MKTRFSIALAVSAIAVCTARSEDVFAGRWNIATNDVQTGATSAIDPSTLLRLGQENRLYKTGGGTLQIPSGAVNQPWPAEFNVKAGTLEFTTASATAPATGSSVSSPAVLQNADLWFEADENRIVTTTEHGSEPGLTYVDRWLDMREDTSNAASPLFFYAQAYYGRNDTAPVFTEYQGFPALYFGGSTSDIIMDIMTNGTVETKRVYTSVFVVHGVETTHGYLVGQTANSSNIGGSYNILFGKYAATDINWNVLNDTNGLNYNATDILSVAPVMKSVKTWFNGEACDLRTSKVSTGQQLYELAWNGSGALYSSIFSDRHIAQRGGGDYISAVVAFKRQISEDERVQVRDYLVRKFLPASSQAPSAGRKYAIAAGATVACRQDGPGITELSGEGTFRKTGSGTRAVGGVRGGEPFAGDIDLQAGTALMLQQIPVKAAAGKRITANVPSRDKIGDTNTYGLDSTGIVVTAASDAPAGTFVKDGNALLAVRGIPDGVKGVTVTGGTLRISAARTAHTHISSEAPVSVSITNPSFETAGGDASASGWTRVDREGGAGSGSGFAAFKCPNANYAPFPAPVGNCMIRLKCGVGMYQDITVPKAGTYEISYFAASRNSEGHWSDLCLIDKSTSATNCIARTGGFGHNYPGGPARNFHRVKVAKAGEYRLFFAPPDSTEDQTLVLDDIKMTLVEDDPDDEWKIPYGDFERFEIGYDPHWGNSLNCRNPHIGITVPGWTFNQPEGIDYTGTDWRIPGAALIWIGHTALGNTTLFGTVAGGTKWFASGVGCSYWANIANPRETGVGQMLFSTNGASVATTFTPPAGAYQLLVDMGYSYFGSGGIAATAEIGGTPVSLGLVKPVDKGRNMLTYRWPVPFTVDGSTAVTLTLAPSGLENNRFGPCFDNVRLTTGLDLVEDGDFEQGTGWTYDVVGGANGESMRRDWTSSPGAWGRAQWNGLYRGDIVSTGTCYQTVHVPAPGAYRFSLAIRNRTEEDNTRTSSGNPGKLKVTLAPAGGAAEDVLTVGYFTADTERFCVKDASVFIPSAGDWTLRLQGTVREYYYYVFDGVKLENVTETAADMPSIPSDLEINLAEGATLDLDFIGTQKVARVAVDGRGVFGTVSAATCASVTGTGALETFRTGTVLILR